MASEYPKTSVNKLGRLANRGTYDFPTIHNLINTVPVLHVSFTDPAHPFPITLPMLGCTGSYDNPTSDPSGAQDIYIHGHIAARLFASSSSSQALPITIVATALDGLVLSLTPFHNSCNYRSAVVYGYASLVADEEEAVWAMRRITENMLPGRWEGSRVPPSRAEVKSTGVLRVRIESASAKVRTGGPSEDRADLKNAELVGNTWTGVVPYWGTWGQPVEGKENGCKEVEAYIEEWRVRETARARGEAFEAIEKGK